MNLKLNEEIPLIFIGQIKHVVIYPFTRRWKLSMKVLITGRPYTGHMIYVV